MRRLFLPLEAAKSFAAFPLRGGEEDFVKIYIYMNIMCSIPPVPDTQRETDAGRVTIQFECFEAAEVPGVLPWPLSPSPPGVPLRMME